MTTSIPRARFPICSTSGAARRSTPSTASSRSRSRAASYPKSSSSTSSFRTHTARRSPRSCARSPECARRGSSPSPAAATWRISGAPLEPGVMKCCSSRCRSCSSSGCSAKNRRELVGAARFELATTCTPCRYATRLRYAPRGRFYSGERLEPRLGLQLVEHRAQFALDRGDIDAGRSGHRTGEAAVAHHCRGLGLVFMRERAVEPVACAADREAFFVEKLANAADEQHLVVLVIAPVAAALHRLQLREFLLPVAKHVRLHPAEVADFTDREVALGGDRR